MAATQDVRANDDIMPTPLPTPLETDTSGIATDVLLYGAGAVAGLVLLGVLAFSGDDEENTASLSFRPVAFDRTFGFDGVFRPNVGPGYIGFRMIRPKGDETHMSMRYAIGF